MAPRDPDADGNYKKNKLTKQPLNTDDYKACILHKKHKVVKLVEAQLQKIREEGLVCCEKGDFSPEFRKMRFGEVTVHSLENYSGSPEPQNYFCRIIWFLIRLILAALLLLLVVWIAAGPLSNKSPHTPISLWNSFITTDKFCTLEKKYLLRWSVSDYPE